MTLGARIVPGSCPGCPRSPSQSASPTTPKFRMTLFFTVPAHPPPHRQAPVVSDQPVRHPPRHAIYHPRRAEGQGAAAPRGAGTCGCNISPDVGGRARRRGSVTLKPGVGYQGRDRERESADGRMRGGKLWMSRTGDVEEGRERLMKGAPMVVSRGRLPQREEAHREFHGRWVGSHG
jgi:hypothetical protein